MDIDHDSPLPKHYQLGEAIKSDIIRNGLVEGDPIASERTLSDIYDVSRFTVRRTISDLVKDGVLRRGARRGAFVNRISKIGAWQQSPRRRLLGVVIPDIEDFFAARLVNGIDSLSHQVGYSIALGRSDEDPERAARQIERMIAEQVAGLILVPVACENDEEINLGLIAMLDTAQVPFVFIDRYVEGKKADIVVSDNFDGAYKCIQHLVDMGHRRIAYLGYPSCSTIRDRIAGYRKCLMDHGILPDSALIVASHPRRESTIEQVKRLVSLEPRVTAIFTSNDDVAMDVWSALREMNLRVPQDVAIAGYDNAAGHKGAAAMLTTTEQPLFEEGRLACQMLLDRIDGFSGEARFACLKSTFVPGGSTVSAGSVAVRDRDAEEKGTVLVR